MQEQFNRAIMKKAGEVIFFRTSIMSFCMYFAKQLVCGTTVPYNSHQQLLIFTMFHQWSMDQLYIFSTESYK